MGVGKNIKRLREQKVYGQAELARMVGISTATLYRVETQDREPRAQTIRKIAECLGVDPAQLTAPDATPRVSDGD